MNSFNHYAFGSVGEWLYRTAGGIDTDGPGFERIIVRPEVGNLKYVKASYDSIHGKIESAWKIDGDQLVFDVTIPLNTTAMIAVPTSDVASVKEGAAEAAKAPGVQFIRAGQGAAVYKVGSGRYHFVAMK
jgi:alpha-L-rhamnosidase